MVELRAGSQNKAIKKVKRTFKEAIKILGISRLNGQGQPVSPSALSTRAKVPASNLVKIEDAKFKEKDKPNKPKFIYRHRVTDGLLVMMGHPKDEQDATNVAKEKADV